MTTPTLKQFQAWSKKHESLALAVCEAMAFAQLKREQVDAYILPIFQTYTFRVDPEWENNGEKVTIGTPKDLYLSNDEETIAAYSTACDQAHRAHGFDGPVGHCPALIAEHLLVLAENTFLDAGAKLFGLRHRPFDLDKREKMLNLLLGACLKSVKEERQSVAA